jgi:hypothetical protein
MWPRPFLDPPIHHGCEENGKIILRGQWHPSGWRHCGVANAGEPLFGYIRETNRTRCKKTLWEKLEQINDLVRITASTAALAGLLVGFDTGVVSGAILFIKGESGLTPFTEELLVSAALLGGDPMFFAMRQNQEASQQYRIR